MREGCKGKRNFSIFVFATLLQQLDAANKGQGLCLALGGVDDAQDRQYRDAETANGGDDADQEREPPRDGQQDAAENTDDDAVGDTKQQKHKTLIAVIAGEL